MKHGADSYLRFLDGDDMGMVELIQDYKDDLTLYLNKYVGNIYVAEGLAEDTFHKLSTERPVFSGKRSFKVWLRAMGRTMAAGYMRRFDK